MRKTTQASSTDVIVIGAGFAGLYALHLLRNRGYSVRGFEAGGDVGGTWYWNRYPGARCDAQSLVYSYTFSDEITQSWTWSEHYATQPEILEYLRFVAQRLDLYRDITFRAQVVGARFDSSTGTWSIELANGARVEARYLILATGALSAGHLPDIPGIRNFQGETYHTGSWPHEGVDFTGKRVAVIGTGSSGVQVIPLVAEAARQLTVFQRTPAFVLPACNAPIEPKHYAAFRARAEDFRSRTKRGEVSGIGDVLLSDHLPPGCPNAAELPPSEREALMEARWRVGGVNIWKTFTDVAVNERTNEIVADFIRSKIRGTVKDPHTAEMLTPHGFPFGGKRPCVGTNYYETFNRNNVILVDVGREPIEEITSSGIATSREHYPLDSIVFATGFDALTGGITKIRLVGREGLTIQEAWSEGAKSYLGLMIAGFPNLFTITGPGSPSVLGNVVVNIEQHVEWLAGLLDHARSTQLDCIEAEVSAQEEWSERVQEAARRLITPRGKSWYLGANIPGKPRVYLPYAGGVQVYRENCEVIAAEGYRGVCFSRTPSQ